MRSARALGGGVALAAVAIGLSGCVTTQETNAHTVLLNQRTLATETPVRVTQENPDVRVAAVTLVHAVGGDGVAVTLINTSGRPLTDLPVSVGAIGPHGRRIYFNDGANGDYYDAHVSAVAARSQVTWVLPAGQVPLRPGRAAPRLFARVGVAGLPPTTKARSLPTIDAAAGGDRAGVLSVSVSNQSGLPQYDLQVYAVATQGGRAVGLGRATIADLSGGDRTTVSVPLLGRAGDSGSDVHIYALPTIFS